MNSTRFHVAAALFIAVMVAAVPSARALDIFDAGLLFDIATPQGEFSDHVDRNGYGLSGFGALHLGPSPIKIGVEAGFMNYGSDSRHAPLSTTIPDVTVKVTNTNNIVLGHLFLRFQPELGAFAPYVDMLGGFNYLFTESKIEDDNNGAMVASSTNYDDFTSSYGFGGGCMIRLGSMGIPNPSFGAGTLDFALDFRVRSLRGGKAEYLKEGSIKRESGSVVTQTERSRTDLILYQIGVSVRY